MRRHLEGASAETSGKIHLETAIWDYSGKTWNHCGSSVMPIWDLLGSSGIILGYMEIYKLV